MLYGRERNKFGPIVQPIGTGVNSLEGLNVGSLATFNRIAGSLEWRGISTMNSGTVVVSISAAAARSGAVITANPIQYTSDMSSQGFKGLAVQSVRAGAFEIVAISSLGPVGNMPVAWVVHQ